MINSASRVGASSLGSTARGPGELQAATNTSNAELRSMRSTLGRPSCERSKKRPACYVPLVALPRALLLVIALLQAGGIIDLVRRETCEAACERNGCKDDCTPGDDAPQCSCHCPSTTTIKPPAIAVAIAPIGRTVAPAFVRADQFHPSPDPREILHVPRLRLV